MSIGLTALGNSAADTREASLMTNSQLHSLLRSDNMDVVKKAMTELKTLPVADAVVLLEQLALESEPEYRCRAVHRMPSISAERAESLAILLLADPHPAVRWNACETLYVLGSKKALLQIAQVVATDPSDNVRSFAAFTLGELGDESALPVLAAAMENDPGRDYEGQPIQATATKAIHKIRSRAAAR